MFPFAHFSRHHTEAKASRWVVRRDRALSPRETESYGRWLNADPRHAQAVARLERTLSRLQSFGTETSDISAFGSHRLHASKSSHRHWPWVTVAAAILMVGLIWWVRTPSEATAPSPSQYLVLSEQIKLPDGSVVELKPGSHLELHYTPQSRLVDLKGDEAFFTVVHNSNRPFIVMAAGVRIHDIGTAFNVRVLKQTVEVLVTQGSVRIDLPITASASADQQLGLHRIVHAGECAIVPKQFAARPVVQVDRFDAGQIRSALAWQDPHLQFTNSRLSTVVEQFNRYNARNGQPKIILGEAKLGDIQIGGSFQANNVESFVRLLKLTLNVDYRSAPGNRIILGQTR